MTNDEYDRVRPVLDMAGRLHRSLHTKLVERGVAPIDALLASVEATANLSIVLHGGDRIAAIEWMRDAIDLFERQVFDQAKGAH